MPYQITEPHPTALPNHYVHTGRGGAGNMYKVSAKSSSKTTPLAKVASKASSHSSGKLSTGRGGAGNIRASSELPVFSFDEELALQTGREKHHDVWHVGRGGAGNWTAKEVKKSDRKYSNESDDSNVSSRTSGGFLGRLSGAFDRN